MNARKSVAEYLKLNKICCKIIAYAKKLQHFRDGKKEIFFATLLFSGGVLLFWGGCGNKNTPMSVMQTDSFSNQVKNSQKENISTDPIKILFVGDMMFDRYIRESVVRYGKGDYSYIFLDIKEKLGMYDLVVGNLEGPIADKKSVSVGTAMDEKRNLVFSFDPTVARTLFDNNIKLVSLGNNHILNQGDDGLVQTKKYLDEAGVEYFGDTGNNEVIGSEAKPARIDTQSVSGRQSLDDSIGDEIAAVAMLPRNDKIIEISGTKIGFVNYNYSIANSFEKAISDIQNIKNKASFVVVCPHWGTEYKADDPGHNIKDIAYKFIDAGADLVVGTHPHVIQVSEEYKGKKIYFSLGNFVFDQYFSPETMQGLGVELMINPNLTMKYGELKFEMTKRGQTELKQNSD